MSPSDSCAGVPLFAKISMAVRIVLMRAVTAYIIRYQPDIHKALDLMRRLFKKGAPDQADDQCVAETVTRIIRSKLISRSRYCLRRSLILYALLRHRHPDIIVNIGMQFGAVKDRGHCWLTRFDKPFLSDPDRDHDEEFHHRMGKKGIVEFWNR